MNEKVVNEKVQGSLVVEDVSSLLWWFINLNILQVSCLKKPSNLLFLQTGRLHILKRDSDTI